MRKSAFAIVGLMCAIAAEAGADVITDWNQTAIAAMKAANIGGNPWSRNLAMMHVAMSDAVNAIDGRYARYVSAVPGKRGVSVDAAAAAAARLILTQQVPAQKTMIDEAYAASIKTIPEGAAKSDGVLVGEQCAAAILADRAADGTAAPDTYRPLTAPGVWVPTAPPLFAQYARAKPWVLQSADQFRPGPPPDLKSPQYARDYNETKELGSQKSNTRTAEQSDAVKFWSQANLGSAWQEVARQLSAAKGLSVADNARLFALLNMGVANTFITDWDAKFTYNYWRPVTAIRNGDQDGNDATERDAGWLPLNATPMHPEYPSQAGIIAGVSIGVLEAVFGPKPALAVTATDSVDAKLQRKFAAVEQMGQEVREVRIWGGIHFRNSLDVAYKMGQQIADYLVANSLKPAS